MDRQLFSDDKGNLQIRDDKGNLVEYYKEIRRSDDIEESFKINQKEMYEEEIDIVACLKTAYKYRKMIILIVFFSMLLAGILAQRKPKMYEASTMFFPLDIIDYKSSPSEEIGMKRRLLLEDLIISILKSRRMSDKVIEYLKLKNLWNEELISNNGALESVVEINLEKSSIIKLSVQTKSPEFSANVVNAYIDNLDEFNRDLSLGVKKNMIQVIDRAYIPDQSIPSPTKKNIMIAGIMSFILALLFAFFSEFIKKSNIRERFRDTS